MRLLGKPANLGEDLSSFRKEVANEITSREKKLRIIQEHRSGDVFGHLVSSWPHFNHDLSDLPAVLSFHTLAHHRNIALFI